MNGANDNERHASKDRNDYESTGDLVPNLAFNVLTHGFSPDSPPWMAMSYQVLSVLFVKDFDRHCALAALVCRSRGHGAGGKCISYLRVSTDKQGKSRLGIEAQRNAVAEYLNGGNWTLVKEIVEVESGKRSDRPKRLQLTRLAGSTVRSWLLPSWIGHRF